MSDSENDILFMKRCLQLAANGKATCSPNPMVGAVVVHQGRIIGEGWHRKTGEPHAEPNAIHSVKNQDLLKESTLYVSLEPCSHYGKTPPCADLIIQKQIPRVVVGCLDPFPQVRGKGIARMQAAGVEVTLGVEVAACLNLNRHFIVFHNQKRPYIILKWAQTADGFMDILRQPGDQKESLKISTPFTQALVHKLRSETDAILVGTNTAILDNPSLSVRTWTGRHPIRAVMDRRMILPKSSVLLNGEISTLLFTDGPSKKDGERTWIHLDFSQDTIKQLLDVLYKRQIQTLLVEGGAKLHTSFIKNGAWDEIHIETSSKLIGNGVSVPDLSGIDISCQETINYDTELKGRRVQIFHSVEPI